MSDDELISVFADTDDPVLTASEIADQVAIGKRAVLNRLDALHEQGTVESKEVGARARVWWTQSTTPDKLTPSSIPNEGREQNDIAVTRSSAATVGTNGERQEKVAQDDTIETALDSAEIPGTEQQQERRRETLRAAYGYLREQGSARKSDFANDVYPDYTGGYSQPGGAWWRKVIRPNLDVFPGVVKPSGGGAWEYIDER